MFSSSNVTPSNLLMSMVGGGHVKGATITVTGNSSSSSSGGVAQSSKNSSSSASFSRQALRKMVEKSLDSSQFPINLQGDANPLGRLMEQYQRLAATDSKSVQEKLEVELQSMKQDKSNVNQEQYTQYANAYWAQGHNWWAEAASAANWEALGYSMNNYAPYLNNPLNLLQAATTAPTASSANTRLPRLSPTSLSSPGKYTRGNCECPNCVETDRVGINNIPMKKRGIHNCHFRGCGKVYMKSSHLKAHLRWHQSDRNTKPRKSGEV